MQHASSREFTTEIQIQAPPSAVWDAIASGEELVRWFAPEARVEPGVGGEVVWSWAPHHVWPQRILVWEPGRRLRTSYDSGVTGEDGARRPLFIDFRLEGHGGTTTLRLVQSGFGPEAAFDQEYEGISRGWPVELRSLRLYLERHRGVPRRVAWSTADTELAPAAAWERLSGPQGLGCGTQAQSLAEGAELRFTTADGDELAGRVLQCHPGELTAEIESLGGAWLRASVDRWGDVTRAWLWLATYGRPEAEVQGFQQRFDALLERLFAPAAAPRA